MKTLNRLLFSISLLLSLKTVSAQTGNNADSSVIKPDFYSIVKDSDGVRYGYWDWYKYMLTGGFEMRPVYRGRKKKRLEFLLVKLSNEEATRRLLQQRPKDSPCFTTGEDFQHFAAKDIKGHMISTEHLAGKIIVLNFWFVKCGHCIIERPYLNFIVDDYKQDSSVVFVSVCLDNKFEIYESLDRLPFKYQVIPDGKAIARQLDINTYPIQVIVNKEGKIVFHTIGYGAATGFWIRKMIEENK